MYEKVVDHYEINSSTMALLSVAHTDYNGIALEAHQKVFVRKTPIQLIKSACLDSGSSYEGRRMAVTYQTGSKQKVPIPVDPLHHIFAFPTHSPRAFECNWIFYHHVSSIQAYRSPQEPSIKSIITFKNGQQLPMKQSAYILKNKCSEPPCVFCHLRNPWNTCKREN
ncbi:competence protein ComK [Alteribacillus sp. JSM 102045]|uniref:competence protein ComK n=1 Tax=Alteribacillus sp. JSM 102045 TaxID=1562101 RepID=UPI0035BF5329